MSFPPRAAMFQSDPMHRTRPRAAGQSGSALFSRDQEQRSPCGNPLTFNCCTDCNREGAGFSPEDSFRFFWCDRSGKIRTGGSLPLLTAFRTNEVFIQFFVWSSWLPPDLSSARLRPSGVLFSHHTVVHSRTRISQCDRDKSARLFLMFPRVGRMRRR